MVLFDVDLKELERLNDPEIKRILSQLYTNGFAVHTNNHVGNVMSKRFPELRKKNKPVLLIGNDRGSDNHFIAFDLAIPNIDKRLSKEFKRFVKTFI